MDHLLCTEIVAFTEATFDRRLGHAKRSVIVGTRKRLFNVPRKVLNPWSLTVLAFGGSSPVSRKERIAPCFCTKPSFNIQQKTEETPI